MRSKRIVILATLSLAGAACWFAWLQHEASAQPLPECSDGIDNDGDFLVDFPADPGCTGPDGIFELDAPDGGVPDLGDGGFVADLGPPDLNTGFGQADGFSSGGAGGMPMTDSPHMPPRDSGCSYAAAPSSSALSSLVAFMLLGYLLRRARRAP